MLAQFLATWQTHGGNALEQARLWAAEQTSLAGEVAINRKAGIILRFAPRISEWRPPADFATVVKGAARTAPTATNGPAIPIRLQTIRSRYEERPAHVTHLWMQTFTFALVCYATTSRPGEIYDLRPEDVLPSRPDRGVPIIIKRTKTGRTNVRKVVPAIPDDPLSPAEWFRNHVAGPHPPGRRIWRGEIGGLLTTDEMPINELEDSVRSIFGQRVTLHGFRRGSAADMVLRGVPIQVVAAKGTWASSDSLIRYVEDSLRLDSQASRRVFKNRRV